MNYILSKHGLENWDTVKSKYRDKNKSLKENFSNFFGNNSEIVYQEYIEYYLKEALPFENAKSLIRNLQSKNIKIIILSNKDHTLLDKEVTICFPNINFDIVYGNGDFKENKPSPMPIIEICKEWNIEQNKDNIWLSQDTNCAIASGAQGFLIVTGNLMNINDINNLNNNIVQIENLQQLDKYLI